MYFWTRLDINVPCGGGVTFLRCALEFPTTFDSWQSHSGGGMNWKRFAAFTFALLAVVLFNYQPAWSQANIGSGSIHGVVTDPQGGVVPNANVTITNTATAATVTTTTTSAGEYSAGSLPPGVYSVRVEAPSFKTTELKVNVEVNKITGGNVKLELGSASTVVEVTSSAVTVNTEQASVGGVLNA